MSKRGKPNLEDNKDQGRPKPAPQLAAEQARDRQEAAKARNAEGSIRARMVGIGRGNQQAGRQGQ
jgi:hypothetical protein